MEPTNPPPVLNDGRSIHDQIIMEILERKFLGMRSYGVPLQAHNGRDAERDALEEEFDQLCYRYQAWIEHKAEREKNAQGVIDHQRYVSWDVFVMTSLKELADGSAAWMKYAETHKIYDGRFVTAQELMVQILQYIILMRDEFFAK